jgi:cytochrome P450 / NADPH-cytochrome P450 reductase
LQKAGATRIVTSGFTDVAKGNLYGDFEEWLDGSLWPALSTDPESEDHDASPDFELSTDARATALRFDVHPATVTVNRKLTSGDEPEKYHLEVTLPSDTHYECGDYLAVLPQNPDPLIKSILAHFDLPWDAVITLKGTGPSPLPLNTPVPVAELLRSYVELSQPVTKKASHLK